MGKNLIICNQTWIAVIHPCTQMWHTHTKFTYNLELRCFWNLTLRNFKIFKFCQDMLQTLAAFWLDLSSQCCEVWKTLSVCYCFFCIFKNSWKNSGQPEAIWSLSAPLSKAWQLQISQYLMVTQLSIKILIWITVLSLISLKIKLNLTQVNRLGKCLKWAALIWKNS